MSSGPIEKVHMVILMQPDLGAAIEFYKQLGVKLIFHIKGKWAEMKLGEVKIGLCPTEHMMDGHRTGIVLQVAHVQAVYDEYKDTISFLTEPKEAVHGIMVSFKDPGGNILDLYQPTPDKVAELIKKTAEAEGADNACVDTDGQEVTSGNCGQAEACCKVEQSGIA